jgi:acetylglutamate kinase
MVDQTDGAFAHASLSCFYGGTRLSHEREIDGTERRQQSNYPGVVTDAETMEVVEQVHVSPQVSRDADRLRRPAVGLTGRDGGFISFACMPDRIDPSKSHHGQLAE